MKNLSLFVFLVLCLAACKDDDLLVTPTPEEEVECDVTPIIFLD